MNNIHCDECGKHTNTTLRNKTHARGIKEMYFKCDHCYYHYTVAVTNKRARKLQRIMKRKRIPYTKNGTSKEQIELDEIMTRLKNNLIMYGVADL